MDICGTDLGTMTELDNRIYFAFGDTFGYADGVCGRDNQQANWRSNVLAWTNVVDPKDGLALSDWLAGPDGRAIAVIEGAHQTPVDGQPTEQTKIPTAMVAVGSAIHLHYMSIHDFAAKSGAWNCNYSAWVTSLDGGQSWTPDAGQFTDASSNFMELALTADVTPDNPKGEFVYALGTPAGRFGAARLGRAPAATVTDPTSWQYCSGLDSTGEPAWAATESAAVDMVAAPVGEASILWNPALQRWMYTYLNEDAAALQLREAPFLWGPWSDPHTLATANDYPQLYGAFMTRSLLSSDGLTLYFVMSQFGPYDTFLMKAELKPTS